MAARTDSHLSFSAQYYTIQKDEFLKLIVYDLVAQAKLFLSCIKELQLAANKTHMLYMATLVLEMRSLSVEGTSMKDLWTLFTNTVVLHTQAPRNVLCCTD